jgi:hypothetical protein
MRLGESLDRFFIDLLLLVAPILDIVFPALALSQPSQCFDFRRFLHKDVTCHLRPSFGFLHRLRLLFHGRFGARQRPLGNEPIGHICLPSGETRVRMLNVQLPSQPLIEGLQFGVELEVFLCQGNGVLPPLGLIQAKETCETKVKWFHRGPVLAERCAGARPRQARLPSNSEPAAE